MTLEERFWSRVDIPLSDDGKPDRNKCWMWKACVDKDGYGKSTLNGKSISSNRFAYELENGKFDKTKCVLHKCDNPGCCNPEHLWLGTQKDNRQDCKNKGRTTRGDKHWTRINPEKILRGDNHPFRLHPEKVARGDKHGSKTHPEKLARGDKHGSKTHPESVARGERSGARTHPEKVARGDRSGARTHPEKWLAEKDMDQELIRKKYLVETEVEPGLILKNWRVEKITTEPS